MNERIDRTAFEVVSLSEAQGDDVRYWLAKTPAERIAALEYLRRWVYGDAAIDARLQRVFEIAQLEPFSRQNRVQADCSRENGLGL